MKKIGLLAVAALLAAGCSLFEKNGVIESFNTGCYSADTRASANPWEETESLSLKYSSSGLVVLHKWTWLNCAFKNSGLDVVAEVNDEERTVRLEYRCDISANCICPVETIQTVIGGLQQGIEYTFYFSYYKPIHFTYNKSLNLYFNVREELTPEWDAEVS